jgi:hypothetical protein
MAGSHSRRRGGQAKGEAMAKKENIPDLNHLTEEEKLKLEIAEEIGVYDKVMSTGWKSLSARESGRIGGLLARRKREENGKCMT